MSILTVLLLAQAPAMDATAAQVASAEVENRIVVIGSKLKDWRGSWRTKKGVVSCNTRKSTGDREIDGIGCDSLIACVTPHVPAMQAIADSVLPKEEKNRRMSEAAQPIGPCIAEKREAAIKAMATRQATQ